MNILNDYEKGFIEAFIDTDGGIYLSLTQNKYSTIKVIFFNKSVELLDKVQRILGSNKNLVEKQPGNYELRYYSNEARELLPQLTLVIKEKKRQIALRLLGLIKKGTNQYSRDIEIEKQKENLIEEWREISGMGGRNSRQNASSRGCTCTH